VADKDFVGHILNRRLFGQWLLRKAVDGGAVLYDLTQFSKPIIEKGFVTGISAKAISSTLLILF
jgi:flavin-dependent dehydrogenase